MWRNHRNGLPRLAQPQQQKEESIMSWFKRCNHEWDVVGAAFTPPIRRKFEYWGFDDIQRFVHGFTSLTQRCKHCGRTDVTEYFGKVDVPGFTWKKEEVKL
jgi:hypothetical protein